MAGTIELNEGDRFHKIVTAVDGPEDVHFRIISKVRQDNSVEGALIFEYPNGDKSVYKMSAETVEKFDEVLEHAIPLMNQIAKRLYGCEFGFETVLFPGNTVEEQMEIIKSRPDLFNFWEERENGQLRPVRTDNNFLLDTDVPLHKYKEDR